MRLLRTPPWGPPNARPTGAARQQAVVAALAPLLPSHALLWQPEDTVPYECDGLTAYRQMPLLVALPETEAQVAAVLRACHALAVPVVARGAGTGLSGGALPHALGVTLSLAKFNKIVIVDREACTATVQCGVRNLAKDRRINPGPPARRLIRSPCSNETRHFSAAAVRGSRNRGPMTKMAQRSGSGNVRICFGSEAVIQTAALP